MIEHAQRLDADFKIRRRRGKWPHRQVCQRYLPSPILKRKKRGFAVNVVDDWFRQSLHGRIHECQLDQQSLIYRYLQHNTVAELLQRHSMDREDHHKILFSLAVLEQWLRSNAASAPVRKTP